MGLQLVQVAFHHAARTRLDHAATRLLIHMAAEAYDDENAAKVPPRRYFRSRSDMAAAMGVLDVPTRRPGASSTPAEHQLWTTGNSRVKRALVALEAAGAIRRVSAGRPGYNAEFELTVTAVDPALLGPLIGPHEGPVTGPHQGPLTGPNSDRSPVPLTGTTELQETAAEHHVPRRAHEARLRAVHNRGERQAS